MGDKYRITPERAGIIYERSYRTTLVGALKVAQKELDARRDTRMRPTSILIEKLDKSTNKFGDEFWERHTVLTPDQPS
jgi:hypothetical protein